MLGDRRPPRRAGFAGWKEDADALIAELTSWLGMIELADEVDHEAWNQLRW
jgi:hypothetical protein